MSFVPDFVKTVCGLFCVVGILALGFWVLQQGTRWDADNGRAEKICHISSLNKKLLLIIFGEGAFLIWRKMKALSGFVAFCSSQNGRIAGRVGMFTGGTLVLIAIFFACMLFATIMDIETHMVYDYVWWLAAIAAIWLCCSGNPNLVMVAELIVFIVLQELFFARMYGRADCHAFAVCAILECSLGMGMLEYLVHMLLAFLTLAVVQFAVGNVMRNGNLKVPVAFLPYISIGCWLTILTA